MGINKRPPIHPGLFSWSCPCSENAQTGAAACPIPKLMQFHQRRHRVSPLFGWPCALAEGQCAPCHRDGAVLVQHQGWHSPWLKNKHIRQSSALWVQTTSQPSLRKMAPPALGNFPERRKKKEREYFCAQVMRAEPSEAWLKRKAIRWLQQHKTSLNPYPLISVISAA